MENNKITPCLWFASQAGEAAEYYVAIFKNSKITSTSYYPKEGFEIHGQKEGTVLTVAFQLNGNSFTALNGGRNIQFNDSISFQVFCDTQEEIDHYWNNLTEGGQESMCGWLKDKFGVSWQIIPSILPKLLSDPKKAPAVMNAFMKMRKFVIADLLNA